MATAPTPGEAEVRRRGRRRLIGAITLVLLLVVFVPMVLDPEPRVSRPEPTLAIPSKDDAPPLPAPAKKSATPAAPVKAPEAAPPSKAAQAPASAKAVEAKTTTEAVVARPPAAAPKLAGFAVQIGAFKEDAKLAQAREKLAAAKVSHYTERLATASGELTRLRAGPFPTREAAEKAAAEVKRAGLDGRVVPLP